LRTAAIVALATTAPAATVCTVAKAPQMHLEQIQAKMSRRKKIGLARNLVVGCHPIILRVLVLIANAMLTVHAKIAQRILMMRTKKNNMTALMVGMKKNKMTALMVREMKNKMRALMVRSKKRKIATMMTKKRKKRKMRSESKDVQLQYFI